MKAANDGHRRKHRESQRPLSSRPANPAMTSVGARYAAHERAHTDQCAAAIAAFWRQRGAEVRVEVVENLAVSGHTGVLAIRSNLVNGRPAAGEGRRINEGAPLRAAGPVRRTGKAGAAPANAAEDAAKGVIGERRARIFRLLAAIGALSGGDIARRLGETYPAVQRGLDRLERDGAVSRQASSLSGRLEWRLAAAKAGESTKTRPGARPAKAGDSTVARPGAPEAKAGELTKARR
jgi:DNA-binding transcriptional ArsR family regulator